jgi:hypothetical protein
VKGKGEVFCNSQRRIRLLPYGMDRRMNERTDKVTDGMGGLIWVWRIFFFSCVGKAYNGCVFLLFFFRI